MVLKVKRYAPNLSSRGRSVMGVKISYNTMSMVEHDRGIFGSTRQFSMRNWSRIGVVIGHVVSEATKAVLRVNKSRESQPQLQTSHNTWESRHDYFTVALQTTLTHVLRKCCKPHHIITTSHPCKQTSSGLNQALKRLSFSCGYLLISCLPQLVRLGRLSSLFLIVARVYS